MSGEKGEIFHHDQPHHHLFRDFNEFYELSSLFSQRPGAGSANSFLHDLPSVDATFPNFADFFNSTSEHDTVFRSVDAPYSPNVKKEALQGMDRVAGGVINTSSVCRADSGNGPATPNSSMSSSSSEAAAMDDCKIDDLVKQEGDEEVKQLEASTKVEEGDKAKKL